VKLTIDSSSYQVLCHFLKSSSGIDLGSNKQYLVENRLSPLLKKFEVLSFSDLLPYLSLSTSFAVRLKSAIIDAMTTNETSWFRDDIQFKALQNDVLPEIALRANSAIKIWSAGCSSGQEPYTMSICCEEMVRLSTLRANIQIIGTDISETVLAEARKGIYSDISMRRGLDNSFYQRYFQEVSDGYLLNSSVMRHVRFQYLNLLESFSHLGQFDVIFCRNVLIYFSDAVKRDILIRLADSLTPGGYLFLSSTETIPIDLNMFKVIRGHQARYFQKIS